MLESHYQTGTSETSHRVAQILTHYVDYPLSHSYASGWTLEGPLGGRGRKKGDFRTPNKTVSYINIRIYLLHSNRPVYGTASVRDAPPEAPVTHPVCAQSGLKMASPLEL